MNSDFDVIIVGGSYSGLSAAMALGRALKKVLIIDSDKPCNAQTPHSHNFLTQDGKAPNEIRKDAKGQVEKYSTVKFHKGLATIAQEGDKGFDVSTDSGQTFQAGKLILATGVRDIMPEIQGYAECWGISVLHCPYCHGYEVRNEPTGILGNGEYACEFASLVSNWTKDLTVYTNGQSSLTADQIAKLENHNINIVEETIQEFVHKNGYLQKLVFRNGHVEVLKALYTRPQFMQHSDIPQLLGCELTSDGYLKVDSSQRTNVPGVFACGDNVARMRTIANAVATGTTAGMMVNKELVLEIFNQK